MMPNEGGPASGTVTVFGSVTEAIVFTPTYLVTFVESGLAAGTTWSISFNGSAATSAAAGTSLVLSVGNGTYPFTVGTVSGYVANVTSSSVHVHGAPVTVAIQFTNLVNIGPRENTFLGLPGWEGYSLVGVLALAVVLGVALAFWRARRPPAPVAAPGPAAGPPPPGVS